MAEGSVFMHMAMYNIDEYAGKETQNSILMHFESQNVKMIQLNMKKCTTKS